MRSALVHATIEGPYFGWGTGPITVAVAAGVGFVAFVAWELRHTNPVLDVRKFMQWPLTGSMIAVLFFFGIFGAIHYSTQFLQFVLGYGPLETGPRLLPLAGAVVAGAAITGRLTARPGMKPMVVTGMVIGTVGVLPMRRRRAGPPS